MMRSPIPKAIREELSNDPWMAKCCLNDGWECDLKIEWHHAFTYAGKRVNELWSILPLCTMHHRIIGREKEAERHFLRRRIKHFKAEKEFRIKFPKSDLFPKALPTP